MIEFLHVSKAFGRQVVLAVSKSVPLQEGMQLPVLREDESGHLQEAGRVVIDEIRFAASFEDVIGVVPEPGAGGGGARLLPGSRRARHRHRPALRLVGK